MAQGLPDPRWPSMRYRVHWRLLHHCFGGKETFQPFIHWSAICNIYEMFWLIFFYFVEKNCFNVFSCRMKRTEQLRVFLTINNVNVATFISRGGSWCKKDCDFPWVALIFLVSFRAFVLFDQATERTYKPATFITKRSRCRTCLPSSSSGKYSRAK